MRSDAATVPAPAGALQGLACTTADSALLRFARLEPLARRAIPAMLILFIGVLAGITAFFAMESRHQTLANAMSDLELVASVIADNLNAKIEPAMLKPVAELLQAAVPDRVSNREQQVFVSDEKGHIIASRSGAAASGLLSDYLGQDRAVALFENGLWASCALPCRTAARHWPFCAAFTPPMGMSPSCIRWPPSSRIGCARPFM